MRTVGSAPHPLSSRGAMSPGRARQGLGRRRQSGGGDFAGAVLPVAEMEQPPNDQRGVGARRQRESDVELQAIAVELVSPRPPHDQLLRVDEERPFLVLEKQKLRSL